VTKMRHYHHFEKNPPVLEKAHIAQPAGAGFDIQLNAAKVESQRLLSVE